MKQERESPDGVLKISYIFGTGTNNWKHKIVCYDLQGLAFSGVTLKAFEFAK
jgi:hypothetical protein